MIRLLSKQRGHQSGIKQILSESLLGLLYIENFVLSDIFSILKNESFSQSKTMTTLLIILVTTGFLFSSVMMLREQKLKRELLEARTRLKKENRDGNTGNG